ncbi:MAG: AAA family ATPase [Phycisphaerae bacterium]|nr:AAA family ATPase [Phycisphaerae bacterium]
MRTFAVINQKGGCGKTTTAINLAAAFADLGRKTLLVDMDPQGHCALGLAVPENQLDVSVADALLASSAQGFDFSEILWQISSNLDLAPSMVNLAAVERRLADAPDRDVRLKRLLQQADGEYDICLIDCPPNIGLLTFNALRAAGEVLIPVETGYFALSGSIKQATTLQVLADRCNHTVCFHVLPTMYDVRTKMARDIVTELRKQFGQRVVQVPIHFNTKLKEAASFGQPINEYDPASRGCQDFERLARYLLAARPVPQRLATPAAAAPAAQGVEMHDRNLTPAARIAARSLREFEPAPVAFEPAAVGASAALAVASGGPGPIASSSGGGGGQGPAGGVLTADVSSRAAELVQRARALAERTSRMHQGLPSGGTATATAAPVAPKPAAPASPLQRNIQGKLEALYGVRVTRQGTLFVQPESGVRSINIAGEFNDWSPVATPMQPNRRLGVWQICLPLPPGRYRYRLVIDDKWIADPHNPHVETNPFGELNSIIEVEPL